MKFRLVLTGLLIAGFGFAQTRYWDANHAMRKTAELLGGEHYNILWTGSGIIKGSAHPCTTAYIQIAPVYGITGANADTLANFSPTRFTLTLKITCYGAGDSAMISQANFSVAYDTTLGPAWVADSTNVFIKSGNYNHPLYGQGLYEVLADTARRWDYPLRIYRPGYIRFIFITTTDDSCNVSWRLSGVR